MLPVGTGHGAAIPKHGSFRRQHWTAGQGQLAKRNISLPESSKLDPVVFMLVTYLRIMTYQHVCHRVLALAGHRLASRLVLVDQDHMTVSMGLPMP